MCGPGMPTACAGPARRAGRSCPSTTTRRNGRGGISNTCQFVTYLHARPPRVNCPDHGVRQVRLPWAEAHARFTLLFERLAIDVLKECDIRGATRILRISWDEAWRPTSCLTHGWDTSTWGGPTWTPEVTFKLKVSSIGALRVGAKPCRYSWTRSPPTATSRQSITSRVGSGRR